MDSMVFAQASFPRGEGFHFSLFSMGFFLAAFFLWMRFSWWVDQDSRDFDLPTSFWNLVICLPGLLGVVLFLITPKAFLGLPLLLLCAFIPPFVYVNNRNLKVPDKDKVFTQEHFKVLATKYLKMQFEGVKAESDKHLPIRFIGKSSDGKKDDTQKRLARAQESEYYQAGLEMIYDAYTSRATDVHLEPTKGEMMVRFRIDGIMNAMDPIPRKLGDAVINIIKVLADLDITEKRKPQDGSFSAEVASEEEMGDSDSEENGTKKRRKVSVLDFRVATAGSVTGEKMVIRILDSSKAMASLKKLGMRDKQKEIILQIVNQPHGMFIVCGPTGAGKSTTLYACLLEIDRFQKNVITLENPVEYRMDNCTQIEINPKAGKTFASELRSILRQDPDVIYVGEIRDKETAEISCQAAQTGHMVFTTLHANDSVTALGRLIDLGVAPFMIGNAVSGILAQRLVRLLCPKCKIKYKPNPEVLKKMNLSPEKYEFLYKARNETESPGKTGEMCTTCSGTGYRGRTGVFEILVLTEGLKAMIRESPNLPIIRQEAVKGGMKYLQEDGLRQVVTGNTSIQEIMRVCK